MSPRPPLVLLVAVVAVAALALAHTGEIRERAEVAVGRGMPPREAALARGFVLGQDEDIGDDVVEDFRRSGLSHLLAVSGQNVALLALLAMPLLAALGIGLRMRLVWVLALIAVYVPLAGAGPTIQRAGAMGALSVIAMLAGRRSSRLYALVFAAVVTLAIEPAIAADIGWQLSFAAVLGILALAAPLRAAIAARVGRGGPGGALAEGAAMTIAATIATAPLIAFHFGTFSTTTLVANVLALPAVAPAMWLGMVAMAAGQVPGFPVEAINFVNAPLLGYVAQVAAWCGRPSWASLEIGLGLRGLVAAYLAIVAIALASVRLVRARRLSRRRQGTARFAGSAQARGRHRARRAGFGVAAVAVLALAWGGLPLGAGGALGAPPPGVFRLSALDVGQGDAILLQPPGSAPILVDTGPAGAGVSAQLEGAGVERLAAVVVTHDEADHAGALAEVLGRIGADTVLFAAAGAKTIASAVGGGARPRRVAAGHLLRSGGLRIEVLWPPADLLRDGGAVGEPNRLSLVLLARWGRFSFLLCADAEAEAVPLDPGPVDVIKVAHHGSEDAGLAALLERTSPRLAIVSVGDDNGFGHPTDATLGALAAHGVEVMRTDRDGTVALDVGRRRLSVRTGS